MKDLEKTLTELKHYQTEFNAIQDQVKKDTEEFIDKVYEIAEGNKMKRYLVCFWVTGETMPRNEEGRYYEKTTLIWWFFWLFFVYLSWEIKKLL